MRDSSDRKAEARDVARASSKAGDARPRWWGRERFFNADGSMDACPSVIDLTGRHRFLLYGPYEPIEAGRWRAIVRFELCDDGARRPFLVQFGSDPDFTTVELPAPWRAGRQEVELEHRIETDGLAQVRVYLARAAFHGEFRFLGVEAVRLGAR